MHHLARHAHDHACGLVLRQNGAAGGDDRL